MKAKLLKKIRKEAIDKYYIKVSIVKGVEIYYEVFATCILDDFRHIKTCNEKEALMWLIKLRRMYIKNYIFQKRVRYEILRYKLLR